MLLFFCLFMFLPCGFFPLYCGRTHWPLQQPLCKQPDEGLYGWKVFLKIARLIKASLKMSSRLPQTFVLKRDPFMYNLISQPQPVKKKPSETNTPHTAICANTLLPKRNCLRELCRGQQTLWHYPRFTHTCRQRLHYKKWEYLLFVICTCYKWHCK